MSSIASLITWRLEQTLSSKLRQWAHGFVSPLPTTPAADGGDGNPSPPLQLVV